MAGWRKDNENGQEGGGEVVTSTREKDAAGRMEPALSEPHARPAKTAIVTGASSGIGLAVAETLLRLGYRVYGIARDFSKCPIRNEAFEPVVCDLARSGDVVAAAEAIAARAASIDALVHGAGVGWFGPHETITPERIHEMVAVNLEAPLVLTRQLLRPIKKHRGWIIFISSVTAKKTSTHGCAYAATKAALSHFAASLFEEIRKSGAKVGVLHPDMTKTPFYDRADFMEGEEPESHLLPECVAGAVETLLSQREGTVVTEMTLRPQIHRIRRKNAPKNAD